jgi:hypothetical protein
MRRKPFTYFIESGNVSFYWKIEIKGKKEKEQHTKEKQKKSYQNPLSTILLDVHDL